MKHTTGSVEWRPLPHMQHTVVEKQSHVPPKTGGQNRTNFAASISPCKRSAVPGSKSSNSDSSWVSRCSFEGLFFVAAPARCEEPEVPASSFRPPAFLPSPCPCRDLDPPFSCPPALPASACPGEFSPPLAVALAPLGPVGLSPGSWLARQRVIIPVADMVHHGT